jgi:hypothetical protein
MLLGSAIAFLVLSLPTEINDIIRSNSGEKLVSEKNYLLSAILLSLAHLNYAVSFKKEFSFKKEIISIFFERFIFTSIH